MELCQEGWWNSDEGGRTRRSREEAMSQVGEWNCEKDSELRGGRLWKSRRSQKPTLRVVASLYYRASCRQRRRTPRVLSKGVVVVVVRRRRDFFAEYEVVAAEIKWDAVDHPLCSVGELRINCRIRSSISIFPAFFLD